MQSSRCIITMANSVSQLLISQCSPPPRLQSSLLVWHPLRTDILWTLQILKCSAKTLFAKWSKMQSLNFKLRNGELNFEEEISSWAWISNTADWCSYPNENIIWLGNTSPVFGYSLCISESFLLLRFHSQRRVFSWRMQSVLFFEE